jgi:tetratricopeptide (TPR) repeat protein
MKPASLAILLATPILLLAQKADWDALDQQIEQLYVKGDLPGAVQAAKLAVEAASTPKQSGRSLDRLGFLYYNSGNLKDGETFLRQGLALRREKLGADSADYAESANDLALFCRDTRRYPEGQALAEEAVAVRVRVLGANDPVVAETLETLGSIFSGEGEYEKSAATFEKARAIYESHIDPKNPAPPEYGTLLVNLAGNYHRLGKFHQAELDFDTALDVLRKTIGPTHPIYATSLMGPGNLEMEIGNYAAAEKFYDEAEPLLKSSLGETHPIYV